MKENLTQEDKNFIARMERNFLEKPYALYIVYAFCIFLVIVNARKGEQGQCGVAIPIVIAMATLAHQIVMRRLIKIIKKLNG